DGHVKGNVIADGDEPSMLVISEHAKVEGEVRVAHLVVNGEIVGPVHSSELLELQPRARITGDVHYKALEMHGGAVVAGKLSHDDIEEPVLKLASSNT
ncbi:MAG: polymer-forming cytoskeletal protein, partial [Paucimonas sp.]|nr:polymer-forming cytoskeletal protein [Paucimonas sp.]